jgi:hypothetical protein
MAAAQGAPLTVAAPSQGAPLTVAAPSQVQVSSEPSKTVFFELKPVKKQEQQVESLGAVTEVESLGAVTEVAQEPEAPRVAVSVEELEEAEPEVQEAISPFEISPTLTLEPQTNSIVIAEIPDPINMGDIVTDAGQILRTGSIEIVPVTTGQIAVVPESPDSDVADSMDSAASFVPSVEPVRASGVMNSKVPVGARSRARRRAVDVTVTSVTLGIVILALTAAGVISYMLGVLR